MYIPTTTHVSPLATIRRERLLPQPGYVLVGEDERVEPTTVVAKTETVSRHFFYDLTVRLDVKTEEAQKFLRVQQGIAVEKGEVIAVRPTMLGFSSKRVRAPLKGTVVEIKDGKVLFAATGPEYEMKAGFPGIVSSVNAEWGVMLETTGALIQGAWGSGKQEYGVLKMLVNDPTQPLAAELLDESCKGAIVVAGTADEKAVRIAVKVKVRGLILGSMSASSIRMTRTLPFPILVVEGFGKRIMTSHAWTLLADHNSREVFLDARPPDRWEGRRPEVIIPLPPPGGMPPLPADGQPLDEGKRVRILRAPYTGAIGTVLFIPARMQTMPSGVQTYVAHVELEGGQGEVVAPVANLEIFE